MTFADAGFTIRLAKESDRSRLYDICLLTANRGTDATDSYSDPSLPGQIWIGPYLTHEPEFAFAAVDSKDYPIGYCVATLSTSAFDEWADSEWWPKVDWSATTSPAEILKDFPSHGHINLLQDARGHGLGRALMEKVETMLRNAGSTGIHLRVDSMNLNAISFYQSLGFEIIRELPGETIVAKRL